METSQTPISRIPDELLLQIFESGCDEPMQFRKAREAGPRRKDFVVPVRGVCRRWKELIDCPHKPYFWVCYIAYDRLHPTERLELFQRKLEATGQYADIHILMWCDTPVGGPWELNPLDFPYDELVRAKQAMDAMLSYRDRIIGVQLSFRQLEILEYFIQILSGFSGAKSRLGSVVVSPIRSTSQYSHDDILQLHKILKGQHANALFSVRNLSLMVFPSTFSEHFRFPSTLENLQLSPTFSDLAAFDQWSRFFATLPCCQCLVNLDLDLKPTAIFNAPEKITPTAAQLSPLIYLPRLRKVNLRGSYYYIFFFITNSRFPSVTSIRLDIESWIGHPFRGEDRLGTYHHNFAPVPLQYLSHLEFSCDHSSSWFILDQLHNLISTPFLSSLRLQFTNSGHGPTKPILPACLSDYRLRKLRLDHIDLPTIMSLLGHIDLRRLEDLHISALPTKLLETFLDHQNLPNLKYMVLEDLPLNILGIIRSPGIESLRIIPDFDAYCRLPNLHELTPFLAPLVELELLLLRGKLGSNDTFEEFLHFVPHLRRLIVNIPGQFLFGWQTQFDVLGYAREGVFTVPKLHTLIVRRSNPCRSVRPDDRVAKTYWVKMANSRWAAGDRCLKVVEFQSALTEGEILQRGVIWTPDSVKND